MIRSRFLPALAAVSLTFAAGCASLMPPPTPVIVAGPPTTIAKVEYGFEATYNLAGNAYLAAAPHLQPATKAHVKAVLIQAYEMVRLARVALAAGNTQDLAARVATLNALVAQVTTLIQGDAQ